MKIEISTKRLREIIQEELQKQKRPGGILSPYGSA